MPTNLYGPNDNFDLESSHVLPAMMRKFHEAKFGLQDFQSQESGLPESGRSVETEDQRPKTKDSTVNPQQSPDSYRDQQSIVNGQHSKVTLWGSGTPMREFLHVDDLAKAVLYAVENVLPDNLYNVGTGQDVTIKQLAETIQKIVGHQGEIIWDSSKPDGTPRKLMDVSKMHALGWKAEIELEEGIKDTYKWFLKEGDQRRKTLFRDVQGSKVKGQKSKVNGQKN
jgi:GDP-L-fucose synthase